MQDANILRATRTASTGEQFMNSLGVEGAEVADSPSSIRGLPLDRRAEPLAALALRISQLPEPDRLEKNREFLKAFNEIPERNRTLNLTALANVAAYSADELLAPATVVWQGANPGHAARFYNIQDQLVIFSIEQASASSTAQGSAGQRVRSGENVQTVANELGFTTQAGISRLEYVAASSSNSRSAGGRVERGENVQNVAKQLGFTPSGIRRLETRAASSNHPLGAKQAIINGATVDEVVERSGFTIPGIRMSLEHLYATTHNQVAAAQGGAS
jgi:AraC-like DNA-binding protein